MTNLSPAAAAVYKAAEESCWDWSSMQAAHFSTITVAALRAIANEVAPVEMELVDGHLYYEKENPIRDQLLTIASEIENHG